MVIKKHSDFVEYCFPLDYPDHIGFSCVMADRPEHGEDRVSCNIFMQIRQEVLFLRNAVIRKIHSDLLMQQVVQAIVLKAFEDFTSDIQQGLKETFKDHHVWVVPIKEEP